MTHLRNEKGQLLPGQGPLPGAGRPPVDPAVRAETQRILQAATPRAAQRLVELMDDPDSRIALLASQAVLDRVMGKPLQQSDVKVTTSIQSAHLAVLMDLQAKSGKANRLLAAEATARQEATTIEPAPAPATDAED